MLVIKLDLEKNKENYQKVVDLLADLDIVSVSWEDGVEPVKVDPKLRLSESGGDLGAGLSSAVDRAVKRHRGDLPG